MKKFFFHSLALVTCFSSCTETIDFEVGTIETTVVVDAEISTEQKAHQVKLTLSTNVYENSGAPPAQGATVTISDGQIIHLLTEVSPGIYETADTVKGYAGRTYTLNIDYNDQQYVSISELRAVSPIECSFIVKGDSSNLFLKDKYLMLMAAQEPEGIGDHYLWNYYVNDTLVTDTVGNKYYADDEFVDGTNFTQAIIFVIDTQEVDLVNDEYVLEMKSIDAEYYDFLYAIQLARFRGSPFDGPPANAPTNISNGGLGFFQAVDVSRKTACVLLDKPPYIVNCDLGCLQLAAEIMGF